MDVLDWGHSGTVGNILISHLRDHRFKSHKQTWSGLKLRVFDVLWELWHCGGKTLASYIRGHRFESGPLSTVGKLTVSCHNPLCGETTKVLL